MDDDELLRALVMATAKSDIPMAEKATLMQAACLLVDSPTALEGWARVLTEHTAPEPTRAGVSVHPFFPASPHRIACMAPAAVAGMCGQREDAAVHRVEELTETETAVLHTSAAAMDSGSGVGFEQPVHVEALGTLVRLGLALPFGIGWGISARGRAWLEAHPREGGEPS